MRRIIGKQRQRVKLKKEEFSPMISEFLFYEDSDNKEEKKNYLQLKIQIREQIKNNFDRSVLTEVLLDLRKDLSGQSQQVLLDLYIDLGIHNDAYNKLKSRKWQVISKGILELTAMNVEESYSMLSKFINHKNGTVRKQAEIAVVTLKEEGISYFLDNTKYKISEWQQLKLLDVLRHKQNFEPPKFSLWLTAVNTQVVLFSLRLIKFYRQIDATKSITTLLKHKNRTIKLEAIDCIKEFYIVDALPTLKLTYWKSKIEVKIAILDVVGEIGNEQELEFLRLVKKKERNFNIKSKVIGMLNKISPESILPTKDIKTSKYYNQKEGFDDIEDIEVQDISEVIETSAEVESIEHEPTEENASIHFEENESLQEELVKVDTNLEEGTVQLSNVAEDEESTVVSENIEEQIDTTVGIETIEIQKEKEKEESEEYNLAVNLTDTDEIDLSFLPKVEDNYSEAENASEMNVEEITNNTEEVIDSISIDFLPLVVEEETTKELSDIEEDTIAFEPTFIVDENELSHQNIIDNKKEMKSANSTEHFQEIDWTTLTEEPNKEYEELSQSSDIHFSEDKTSIFIGNEPLSFSANFMEESELETMVLLEDIADMGDEREIPVLRELLEKETSVVVIDRVEELLLKFSAKPLNKDMKNLTKQKIEKSVFEKLLKIADYKTGLFLLNEMAIVGGEKELKLLDSLIEKDDKKTSRLAKKVKHRIVERIQKQQFIELSEKDDDLFNIAFDPSFDKYSTKEKS